MWEFLHGDRWTMAGKGGLRGLEVTVALRKPPKYEVLLTQIMEMAEAGSGVDLISRALGIGAEVVRDALRLLPRHKAANWVNPGRRLKSTRPGANGVFELSPFEFLDRLADLVPPPRKHRHSIPRCGRPTKRGFKAGLRRREKLGLERG
jgi:hypothetical protein